MTEKTRKVLGLIRVSTDAQDTMRQKTDLERVSRTHGLTIERTLPLDGVSGRTVRGNPEVQRLLAELKRPDISGVAIAALDRLFRPDRYEDFGILDHFRDAGKLIFSAKEGVLDPASDMGFLMSLMSGAVAGQEWRTLRQRTQDGKREKRLLGRNVNGSATLPSGLVYQRIANAAGKTVDHKWSYDRGEVAKVREAYRLLFLDRYNLTEIERLVGWSRGKIRTLQNATWRGVRLGAPMADETEPVEIPLPLKPLLTRAQWSKAQVLMAKRTTWTKATSDPRFLGAGLLFCECGAKYYFHGDRRRGGHDSYFCSSKFRGAGCGAAWLRRDVVDPALERMVSEHLTNAAFLAKVFARVERPAAPDLHKRERELAKLAARRQKWIKQFDADRINQKEFEQKMDAVKAATHEIEAQMPVAMPPALDQRAVVAGLVRWALRFPKLTDFEQKRTELRRVIRRIPVIAGTAPAFEVCGSFLGEFTHTNSAQPSKSPCLRQCPAPARRRPSA
jgi:DNA invertase Pin-like site-specific DNA recombinase